MKRTKEALRLRELAKFKERYDFTLDSRQLGLVLFSALVAGALIFVLGMSVGRQWEKRAHAEKAATDTMKVVSIDTPAPDQVVPAAPPVSPPDESASSGSSKEEKNNTTDDAAVKDTEKPPEQETMKPEDMTFPQVLTGKAKPKLPPPKQPAPAARKGAYTVQVGAYRDKAAADALAAKLKKRGYSSGVQSTKGSGGKIYKVHVGNFKSKDDAKRMADRLASREKLKPYVTTY
jgi:cell division protein FtsN